MITVILNIKRRFVLRFENYHIKKNGEGDMNLHCVVYVVIDFPDQEA